MTVHPYTRRLSSLVAMAALLLRGRCAFAVICAAILGLLHGGLGVPAAGGGGNTAWNSNSNNWGDDRGRAAAAGDDGGWGGRDGLPARGEGWTEWGDWDYGT